MQHTRYPYLDYVELFTATGGCYVGFAGCEDTRDLLNDPSAPGLSSGVNASRLIVPLRHILDTGFTPHIVYVERDATIRPEFHAHLPHQVCCANTPLFPAHWSAPPPPMPPLVAYMRFMLVDAMHVAYTPGLATFRLRCPMRRSSGCSSTTLPRTATEANTESTSVETNKSP